MDPPKKMAAPLCADIADVNSVFVEEEKTGSPRSPRIPVEVGTYQKKKKTKKNLVKRGESSNFGVMGDRKGLEILEIEGSAYSAN